MLILSRHAGESFLIGDDITVTVLSSQGNQIRLGIDAPKDVPVNREEIYHQLRMKGQNLEPFPPQKTEARAEPKRPTITTKPRTSTSYLRRRNQNRQTLTPELEPE